MRRRESRLSSVVDRLGAPLGLGGPAALSRIAFDTASYLGSGSNTFTHSFSVGVGANKLLVLSVCGDASSDLVTAASYNSVAMTLALKHAPAAVGGSRWAYEFYLLNPAAGSHTVSVTSTSAFVSVCAASYFGVRQSAQPNATGNATSTTQGSNLAVSVTSTVGNCWLIGALQGNPGGSTAPLAGTGTTRRCFDTDFGTHGLFDSNALVPAGSNSLNYRYADVGGMVGLAAAFVAG